MIRSVSLPGILLALSLWFLLTQGNAGSWIIGIPFIALAIYLRPTFQQPNAGSSQQINFWSLFTFVRFFLMESIRGGIDVTRRVLSSSPDIKPFFYPYPLRLKVHGAQQLFINSISLLPGTLCADWQGQQLQIHALNDEEQFKQGVIDLEKKVADIFGEPL